MILSRFMQHLGSAFNGVDGTNYTTFLATCQVRANRQKAEAQAHIAKYLKDWASSAPRAVRHWRQIDLTVMPGEKIKKQVNGVKTQTGKMIKWETSKGKAGTHEGITGEVAFEYDGLIDQPTNILFSGFRYGVIEEQDGLLTLHRECGEDVDWTNISRERFVELVSDTDNELMLRREILAAAGHKCTYR